MKTFDSLAQAAEAFLRPHTSHHIDQWTVAGITHAGPGDPLAERLGFRPTLLTLANPFTFQTESVVVKDIAEESIPRLKQQLRQRYIAQFEQRFKLFDAEKYQADAVYDSWSDFAGQWVQHGSDYRLPFNLPLLFDHVSDIDYWAWQQKQFDPVGNQRLIVTIFQQRTNKFAEVFIGNVSDAELGRIKLLLASHVKLNAERILYAS